MTKEYTWVNNQLISSKVKEILRGDPVYMRIVMNKKGVPGRKWKVCLDHRYTPLEYALDPNTGEPVAEPSNCPECGKPTFEVLFVQTDGGTTPRQYFIEGEVHHSIKYELQSILYGFSPILTVWKLVSALLNMEGYINEYYRRYRHPKGIVSIQTSNAASA